MVSVFLAGATGMVGGVALNLLLRDDRVSRVVAPTRRSLVEHPKLLNPLFDHEAVPRDADWWANDGAICAIGTTRTKAGSAKVYRAIDHDYPLTLATSLRAAGTQRFALVTSMGADAASWFRYTRTKGELEGAISRLAFPSLTIVRPGFLSGERQEHRPLEKEIDLFFRIAAPILPAIMRASPAETVAHILVEAAIAGAQGRHMVSSRDIARARPAG